MKKILAILLVGFNILLSYGQTVSIPDANFLSYLKTTFPSVINSSDELIISEAAKITGSINCSNKSIASIEGIQYFTGVTSIYAQDNLLTSVPDVSPITNLEVYQVHRNQITSLPSVSSLTKLRLYFVYENQLTELPDLRNNLLLEEVLAYKNKITSIFPFTGLNHLTKLYLYDNLIDSMPDLSGLTALENLQLQRNKITYLPSLDDLTSVQNLQVNGNKLTSLPDLSKCTCIKSLNIRSNNISTFPNINSLTQLTSLDIRNNNLSYEDFISILAHPNYSTSNFVATPQNTLIIKDTIVYSNSSLSLSHSFDLSLAGTSFQWYKDGSAISGATSNSLLLSNVSTAESGFYVCRITNASFPSTSIPAYTLLLTVMSCPSDGNVQLEILKNISCVENGSLVVRMTNVYTSDITYKLTASIGNKTSTNTNGYFSDLDESQYNLSIKVSEQCSLTYSSPIFLSKEKCNETFITPNGDNDKDEYVFEDMGIITIYDKNGRLVKSISTPGSWDGTDSNGKLVTIGLYIAKANTNKVIYITVLY